MQTHIATLRLFNLNIPVLCGLVGLGVLLAQTRAAEQPRPGPEHKKLEAFVGEWLYEGACEPSPFFAAGSFKGKNTNRMVLGGFFMESRGSDMDEHGYVFEAIELTGYDPVTKSYVRRGFENDGSVDTAVSTVKDNVWTSLGSRTDKEGKVYKTRYIQTFAQDGRSYTFSADYSSDDGKTWSLMWKGSMTRVAK